MASIEGDTNFFSVPCCSTWPPIAALLQLAVAVDKQLQPVYALLAVVRARIDALTER